MLFNHQRGALNREYMYHTLVQNRLQVFHSFELRVRWDLASELLYLRLKLDPDIGPFGYHKPAVAQKTRRRISTGKEDIQQL